MTLDEVYEAVKVIEHLEPKPGRPYFSDSNSIIIPDVYVLKHEGEWVVLLNDDGLPRLRISPYYRRLLNHPGEDAGTTKTYLEEKLKGAQWIIRSIDQRNKTIVKVVKSLVKFQEAFLEKGIQYLRPLVLKQVADDVGMHESTISRVTTNKYMHCPQGILELKFFLTPEFNVLITEGGYVFGYSARNDSRNGGPRGSGQSLKRSRNRCSASKEKYSHCQADGSKVSGGIAYCFSWATKANSYLSPRRNSRNVRV